jgi:mannose-1-phosphate guanylyltransferase
MVLEGLRSIVKCGDVIVVEPNMKHSIRAISDLEIIEVQTGEELVEEDIVRLELKWDDIIHKYVELSPQLEEV